MNLQVEKLSKALQLAHLRVTGNAITPDDLSFIMGQLIDKYSTVKIDSMLKFIKKGSEGKYGRSMRFTFQKVNYWIINETLKDRL